MSVQRTDSYPKNVRSTPKITETLSLEPKENSPMTSYYFSYECSYDLKRTQN